MPRFCYNAQHKDFLREWYPQKTLDELTHAFNVEFGVTLTKEQIRYAVKNHSIKSGRKTGSTRLRSFTTEQYQFCVEQYRKLPINALTQAFNNKFNTQKTVEQIRAFTRNHGIKSGRSGHFSKGQVPHNKGVKGWQAGGRAHETQFKKGCIPIGYRPLGSERINVDGYVEVKTAEPNVWELKQRVVYKREVGPIKPRHNIRFKDGNKQNFTPSNLLQVSNSESMYMTLNGYNEAPRELKDTVVALSKLQAKTNQLTSNR